MWTMLSTMEYKLVLSLSLLERQAAEKPKCGKTEFKRKLTII